ncbi:hypothetical protein ACFLYU_03830 [Candidatus Dependentiae bacterium]
MKMKYAKLALVACAAINLSIHSKTNCKNGVKEVKEVSEQFIIKIESKWEDLEKNNKKKMFDDKWILAGDIIIKKTASDYVSLHELHLYWNGKTLDQLIASLYEKNSDKNFMPIERYLICDSVWKKSEQKLILKFEKPKTLYAVNKLSLVLTIPKKLEKALKEGHFTIDKDYLPEPYKEYASEHNLCLYLGDKPK